jgi:hypothetical protein
MNYELLSSDKKQMFLDLANKAVILCPGLAGEASGRGQSEKISELAKTLAEYVRDPVLP